MPSIMLRTVLPMSVLCASIFPLRVSPFYRLPLNILLLLATWSVGFAAQAAPDNNPREANVILHSTITGNQEQPKVLYIVPWQPPGGVDQLQQPVQSLLSDVFAPVDRAEFQRELKYRAAADKAATDAAVTP